MQRTGRMAAVVLLAATAALAGCRADEQNRALHFDKGKYEGEKDQALSPDQLKALRERAELGH